MAFANWWSKLLGRRRPTNETGLAGEKAAEAHLRGKGYRIRDRNWRCKIGEIDLICEQKNTVIFVEVKASKIRGAFPPELRVNYAKQRKLRQLASIYLKRNPHFQNVQYDVISVSWNNGIVDIRHFENAF